MPSHSIAKSAVKPTFSPLPHPTFFAPKSPFFPLFPVLDSISGTFSRNRARFLPCEVHFFLVFPRFGSDFERFFERSRSFFAPRSPLFSRLSSFWVRLRAIFRGHALVFCPVKLTFFSSFLALEPTSGDFSRDRPRFFPFYRLFPFPFSHFESKLRRFFEGTSLFSAPKLTFSLLFPVFPHASGTSSRDLTLYFLRTPLFALREGFSDSCFPHSSRPAPSSYSHCFPFRPSFTPPSSLPPPLSFSFLPTFPFPFPINARTRARVRTHLHVRRFSFIAFTASPIFRNPLCTNALGVKQNEKKPSPNTHPPHNQHISTKHPISSTVNFI